jgi:hypothetical protein
MFTLDLNAPGRVEAKITLAAGSFVLFLQPPSLDERTIDDGLAHAMYTNPEKPAEHYLTKFLRRLDRVIGWDGVRDSSDKPIPFTPQALRQLLNKVPAVIPILSNHLHNLYSTDEVRLGESGSKPDVLLREEPADIPSSANTAGD